MQIFDFKNKNIVLADEVKLLVSLAFSLLFGLTLIGGNIALYAITSLVSVFFLVLIVVLKPYLFLAVFFAVSYPVSQTIGKLEVDNLGILFLLALSLLALVFIIQRKNFSVDQRKIVLFSSFYVIVAVVLFGSVSGFLHSGHDSLEILVKFFVFGVIPMSFLLVMPLNKENMLSLLELGYYLNFIIFMGFSIAYWFFRLLNPASFDNFFYGYDNPIGTSLFMSEFSLVSFVFLIFEKVSHKRKIFIYLTIMLATVYVLLTFQRSFILAIAVALIYFIISKYKISFKMIAVFSVFVVIFALALTNISMFLNVRQLSKLEKTISFVEKLSQNKDVFRSQENKDLGTIGYRIVTILAAVGKIKEHPYFGNGLGTFSNFADYKYPHNIIVEFLYSTGLVGLCVFLFFIGRIFASSHFMIKKMPEGKLKNIFLVTNSFIVLSFVILQFSGGVMNIFPNLYFMLSNVTIALYWMHQKEQNINQIKGETCRKIAEK